MELPLQITFHRLTQSNVIAAKVRQRAQKLEQRFEGILSCRVAIEALEAEPLKRKQLRVRLEIGVPGSQLVVTRDPDEHRFDPDGLLTINEAFCAMRQKLEAYRSFLNGGPTMQPSLDAEANDTGSACESARRLPYFRQSRAVH